TISVADYLGDARLQVMGLENSLKRENDPGPLLKAACQNCQWKNVCWDDAKREANLTLLPNMREATVASLKQRGIRNLKELAGASPEKFLGVPYVQPK